MSKTQFKNAIHAWQNMTDTERSEFRHWIDASISEVPPVSLKVEDRHSRILDQRLAEALATIQSLKSDNYKLSLLAKGVKRGIEAALKSIIDQADADRKRLEEAISELQTMVPWDAMNPDSFPSDAPIRQLRPDGRWQYSFVQVTMVARDSDGPEYNHFTGRGLYMGDREMATSELGMRILFNLFPNPLPEDLPKTPKGFEGLDEELFAAIVRLAIPDSDGEPEERRALFDELIWIKLDNPDSLLTRSEALDRFNKYVDSAFENFQKRRKKYQHAGVRMFHSDELEQVTRD